MSGGAKGKKANRTKGWEEAGLEFYQESYPSNPSDFDVLQQNPKHLTTLLPSKQSRVTTTIRARNHGDNTTRTVRRHQSLRRESTVRRASTAPDETQVALMPDLSQDLSNEKKVWSEIMDIKNRPISMTEKRAQKAAIQNEPNLRLQGYDQFKWKQKQFFERLQTRITETLQRLQLWRSTLKTIEGNYGTGIVAYFIFIKCLMFLNLIMFTLVFLFIILPMLLTNHVIETCTSSSPECGASCAPENELDVVNLIQGGGFIHRTIFYYGAYRNLTLELDFNGTKMDYNLPLAYIATILACYGMSLMWIGRAAAKGIKQRLVEGEGQFYNYCNIVFASWDFCIENQKAANKKHEAIYKELKNCLQSERDAENHKMKSHEERTKLLVFRILVNILVVTILLAAAAAIYFVFEFSNNILITAKHLEHLQTFYEFLPSLSIVILNTTIPFLFYYLNGFENYNPNFAMRITLIRTVFLRLFSLFVLYASLYTVINYERKANQCSKPCWETYIGQQMYKLALVDFANHLFTTLVVNFVRSRIGKLRSKCAKFIGAQSFYLPKHVLDIVYLQTLCWFGMFYAPFLPAMFTVVLFVMFYVKKFACLVNSRPASVLYRESRANSLFMNVLLICFITAVAPVCYSIGALTPSSQCGPFRSQTSIWTFISGMFVALPQWIQSAVTFLCTSTFCIPIFLLLMLCLYYYVAVTNANRHMVVVLKNQLVLEGHDKQFLLEKLSSFIKQQQHLQKRVRQNNELLMMRDGDRNIASN